jgi:hypothetical protein
MSETIHNQLEQWSSALKAWFAYFVIVFGVGFVLGIFRVLILVPAFGERSAVMLELPIMLVVSWFSSQWLIARFDVVDWLMPRVFMGGLALALLIVGEVSISMFGFGRTLAEHLASYRNVVTILGLLAQLAFGMFPAIQLAIKP